MTVLTIVSHGTANSTNVGTSDGFQLVISKIAELLSGVDWLINEGAGTAELRQQGIHSPDGAGVAGGVGVEANVTRSVAWVKRHIAGGGGPFTVNLAGHSRGSITCYKIARALSNDQDTARIPINIFAIDPVPGNTGHVFTKNGENYKNIILGGNVWRGNSFLMLAESEHRLVFRPYVDALYSVGLPEHRFDTIPGTHGGINMLGGPEAEAADIVLSRALAFLVANGSTFDNNVQNYIKTGPERLTRYAELMIRIKKYKAHATVNPFRGVAGAVNFGMSGFQVERHRIANVVGKKDAFGTTIKDNANVGGVRRDDFHGKNLGAAIEQMTGEDAHAGRAHRFFCNADHQELFAVRYPPLFGITQALERSGVGQTQKANFKAAILGAAKPAYDNMSAPEKVYFDRFLEKRGINLG